MTMARRRLVRVPASSANLGPGFDVLAVAAAVGIVALIIKAVSGD